MMKMIKVSFVIVLTFGLLFYIIVGVIKGRDAGYREMKGVFVSYLDYSSILKNKDYNDASDIIKGMILKIDDMGLNTIFLQVRPFADAIYKSSIYPVSKTVSDGVLLCDYLELFIKHAHSKNIKVHAWINPYRISNNSSSNEISAEAIYKDWVLDNRIMISDNGIYFNPASSDVLKLILDGIKEIINNYDVDGIMYDDYFYPNDEIDIDDYTIYRSNGGKLTIEDFRRENIKRLIKESYETVKSLDKSVLFGISPAGNISNNMNKEYLDIKYILSSELMLDYVMPQLYFGFNNGALPYHEILNTWHNLIKNETKLTVALALYKSGGVDKYAKDGYYEWQLNSDIIKKQIILARNKSKYYGFGIFRYDFLFSKAKENDNLVKERENLKELLSEQ